MANYVTYDRAATEEDLIGILQLQKQNLKEALTEVDIQKGGFVSIKHDFSLLKKMNDGCAHCIAKQDGKVVGYAL